MDPNEILRSALDHATRNIHGLQVTDPAIIQRLQYVAKCLTNRAGVRLLLSCLLAKIHNPNVDPRKPYTEIGDDDSFSGRTYDETYITHFINEHRLPCNSTTAFLTPALRNMDRTLTTDLEIIGRPRRLYLDAIHLLDDVHQGHVSAEVLLVDLMKLLLQIKEDDANRVRSLLESLARSDDALPLSCEGIVTLIQQHLDCKGSSRLPVLVVSAAYCAASERLKEKALPLKAHNAADQQTKALGDVEICLINDDDVVTVYEMKNKHVTVDDIDRALQKIAEFGRAIDNYIFITTDAIDHRVREHAREQYQTTLGIEIAVLNCIGFLRHFLHLFSRIRIEFLNAYQDLVLREPTSAVSQPLKEAFLALRRSAESGESD